MRLEQFIHETNIAVRDIQEQQDFEARPWALSPATQAYVALPKPNGTFERFEIVQVQEINGHFYIEITPND